MAQRIADYGRSIPSNASGTLSRPIPLNPTQIKVAEFGLSVPSTPNNVELISVIGLRITAGGDTLVRFQIFRNTAPIYTLDREVMGASREEVSLHWIDTNAPVGHNKYFIIAKRLDTGSQVFINGPVAFSGKTIVPSK